MPLRIELDRLWTRIQDRFKARTRVSEDDIHPFLEENVQPITDFDELAKDHHIYSNTVDISAASGYTALWQVPAGKKWTVFGVKVPSTTGSTSLNMSDATEGTRIQVSAAGTSFTFVQFHGGIPLEEADLIEAANTNNGGDSSRNFGCIIQEEDAF